MTSPRASLDLFLGAPSPRIPRRRRIGSSITSSTYSAAAGGSRSASAWAFQLRTGRWVVRGAVRARPDFALPDARDYQYQSLTAPSRQVRDRYTALMFRALGQVLHVVEDMAQPQHTRNDPHADCAEGVSWLVGGHSWYEEYIEARALRRPFQQEITPNLVLGGYDAVPTRLYPSSSARVVAVASRTSAAGKPSPAGTNLGGDCTGLLEPPCDQAAYRRVSVLYSARTLKGTVSAPLTFYVRDVVDRLSNGLVPSVPVTSRSLWDEHLQAIGRSQKFTLNRFNYDAMADVLLPRAVGYGRIPGRVLPRLHRRRVRGSADDDLGLDRSDGGDVPASLRHGRWHPPRAGLLDATHRPRRIQSGRGAASSLRRPGRVACWLIFRGQLGDESGAVVGTKVGCPQAPTPPPHDPWVLYSCIYGAYENQTVVRYRYATTDPPLANDGLAIPRFFLKPTGGETVCSLLTLRIADNARLAARTPVLTGPSPRETALGSSTQRPSISRVRGGWPPRQSPRRTLQRVRPARRQRSGPYRQRGARAAPAGSPRALRAAPGPRTRPRVGAMSATRPRTPARKP